MGGVCILVGAKYITVRTYHKLSRDQHEHMIWPKVAKTSKIISFIKPAASKLQK